MEVERQIKQNIVLPELYFLIGKFLSSGPLQNAAEVFVQELERQNILPRRIDWSGQEHEQSFEELERKYSHIGPQHLLEICSRLPPLLERELIPSVPGVISLLGAGRQSLLRSKDTISRPKGLIDHCTRWHAMPLMDPPTRKNTKNIVQVLYGRQSSGPITRKLAITPNFYGKQELLRRTLGHLSAVYCVLFDRSGKYIITGADDLLVKLWSAIDGRLLTTFRGASAEITDIAVNLDNTLLAAGSLDRILRVWDLQTAGPIAVLSGHTGMITSVNFCPSPKSDLKYLVTTSTDGSVAFWQYSTPRGGKTTFAPKPVQYHEKLRPGQAQMICASFSPGGIFLAAGSADHHVRVYIMTDEGPKRILEIEAHTDTVDSIQWAHSGLRFISGSKDGMAHVWNFESQQWKPMKLNMSDRLPSCPPPEDESKKLKVTMVSWDFTDKWVITAVNDFTIKVWNASTGKLHKVMRGHTDELYVLESHPKEPHILVSAGHDGQMFIWDIFEGISIASFVNHIEGQGHGGVFDAKWSPDGQMIAATDSHGHILMYGFGSGHPRLKSLPKELFFHTDYRPLVRDVNHFVMDEQTQTAPHLMPPPFLVDVDGNPHPPSFQRLVPGRESCSTDQLVPNITVGPEGVEVVESPPNVVSNIDMLIAALAHRQGPGQAPDSNNDRDNPANRSMNSPRANGSRVALRRQGDVEGVRQSSGNWHHENNFKWIRRIYVRPMQYSRLQSIRMSVYVSGQNEQEIYRRELRRRPMMINTSNASSATLRPSNRNRGRNTRNLRAAAGPSVGALNAQVPAYRTRAVREREHVDEDEEDNSPSSGCDDSSDSTAAEEDLLSGSSSTDTESSDYSDWVANDQSGQALEPPKRSKRKPVQNRSYSPSSDMNQNNNKGTVGRKKIPIPENGEIPEIYRPPEWLSEVVPRKAPYYPQMGDEVVYFRQGHHRYLDAVRSKKVYKLGNNCEPWQQLDLREHEVVKVIGIKYEIRPPRLCCLKLALMNNNGSLTGQSFAIKYHDMPDVLDFIVLRQTYDTAVRRLWTPGERFRCMIDDGWWMGLIESRQALSPEFVNSLFMCFRIRWDNGEYEFMSPWDMEPIDQNRLPAEVGGAVPVTPEELRATLYQPRSEEWPRGDRDATCRRIVAGLEQVMGLAIADPFLAPVDLNAYPDYAYVVEYPIDLATIKARFENHFYRRLTSAQFDVRYLATNAEKFNQSNSHIVKHARIITDLCLRIIKDPNDVDVRAVYHQLMDTYVTSDSDNDNEAGPSTSTGGVTPSGARRSKRIRSDVDWRVKCRELLEMIWQLDDSTPFREPVDLIDHPDYLSSVDTPMDLRTVKEDLLGGNYESPADFVKDMRLIFANSRNYNTNKRSRIYSMTLRLSSLFEAQLKTIVYNWKSTKRRAPKNNKMTTRAAATNANVPGTSRQYRRANNNSDTDDDDDDDDEGGSVSVTARNGRPSRRNLAAAANGVSSSVQTEPVPGPSTSSNLHRSTRRQKSRSPSHDVDVDDLSDHSTSSQSSSSSGNDSEDSAAGIPLSALGVGAKQRRKVRNSDSEDSYKPNKRNALKKPKRNGRSKRRRKEKENHLKTNGTRTTGRPSKGSRTNRRIVNNENADDDDDDDSNHDDDANDEDYNVNDRDFGTPKKRSPGRPKRVKKHHTSSSGAEDSRHSKRTSKRQRRYESDHSYHLNATTSSSAHKRRLLSESDNEPLRPTRRRMRNIYEASSQDNDEAPQASSSQYSRRRRRKPSDSDHSNEEPNTSQSTSGYRRSTRTQILQEDDSEDDQVLSQLSVNSAFRTRPRRNYREEDPLETVNSNFSNSPRRRDLNRQASTSAEQQHQPHQLPTSSQSSLIESTRMHRSHVQEDHNYGEPGPSSLRHSRRTHVTLSRHQRNADELDFSTASEVHDPLEPNTAISGRLRQRQSNLTTNSSTNSSTIPISSSTNNRRIISRRNVLDESLVDTDDDHITPNNHAASDDDDDEDDDDKPLRYMAMGSRHHTAGTSSKPTRSNRNGLSNSATKKELLSQHYTDDEDAGPSTSRSTRTQKRLYYNEDSDDSVTNHHHPNSTTKKRLLNPNTHHDATTTSSMTSSTRSNSTNLSMGTSANGIVRNPLLLDEESDSEQPVSVSSRGRVRKITAKARGLFRE